MKVKKPTGTKPAALTAAEALEKMIAKNPALVPASALAAAAAEVKKQKEEEEKNRAIQILTQHQKDVAFAVAYVRSAREIAAKRLAYLKALNAAGEAYVTSGDSDAYRKAVADASKFM